MAAKSFKGGMDTLLGEATGKIKDSGDTVASKRGRPKTNFKPVSKTSQIGTKENETRATFIINEDQLEAVKALAHWERLSIKEVLGKALDAYITGKKRELPKAMESYKGKKTA